MTHHNRPCMALRITVLTTKGLVCHSEYQYSQIKSPVCHSGNQYSPLRALYVTQGISNHHYWPCMSLRAPVLTTTCLVCHTSIRLVCHALYQYQPLSAWYVNQRTSTEIFYSSMPPRVRVCHGRRTVLNIGGGGGANLSQPWFVAGHEGVPPCISKLLGWPGPLAPCSYAYVTFKHFKYWSRVIHFLQGLNINFGNQNKIISKFAIDTIWNSSESGFLECRSPDGNQKHLNTCKQALLVQMSI